MWPDSAAARVLLMFLAVAALGCTRGSKEAVGPTSEVASAPIPSPSPSPSPSAAPASPAPADQDDDAPAPSPSPACIHGTYHGVDSVSLGVYFLECGGNRIPGSEGMTTIPLGCRIHFNATPRDGMGRPTCSLTWPVWQVGPEELVAGHGVATFTPAYTARREGRMSARCLVDGVRSRWLVFDIVQR
ncbi:MAG TPA: hypothetical protein VMR21_00790 [Vicinamibacteria bacterium]|nr:hypothetical protein [Vicinamibacteria bacterium]